MQRKTTDRGGWQALRAAALRLPGAEEGIACKGTALECSAFKARKKTFCFLGAADLRVKLRESLSEVARLASKEPVLYQIGSLGWVKVSLAPDTSPPLDLLRKWIDESYRLVAGKGLPATPPEGSPSRGKKKVVMKKAGKRRTRE